MTELDPIFERYRALQQYVGWTSADAEAVRAAYPLLAPHFKSLVEDFYATVQLHAESSRVITGGAAQVARLQKTLHQWLEDLFSGCYDAAYVQRRWRVGRRHVEIGLDQVFAAAALARLRTGLLRVMTQNAGPNVVEQAQALNRLIDLDMTIIQDAYLAESRDRQQRQERLATIGQVSAGIAHELRNPLNVVRTSVYYLLNASNATPEKVVEHLRRIERQVGLADNVITALANFSRLPLPELRPLPLEHCLREAVETSAIPGSIQVSLDIEPAAQKVLGDQEQLRIVFSNLFRNARDAMPEGGRLQVSARRAHPSVEVAVADTGGGIPAEALARVMEPLYSTKARGLGLGLAIARAIVEKHQGAIQVESKPGRGSTFRVRLLAAEEAAT